jgi:hypothetical protein
MVDNEASLPFVREPFGSSALSVTDLTDQKKKSMKNLLTSCEIFQHKKEKPCMKNIHPQNSAAEMPDRIRRSQKQSFALPERETRSSEQIIMRNLRRIYDK